MSVRTIAGPVFAIAGPIDTDTIIKSRHCTTADPTALGRHCLAELDCSPAFVPGRYPVILCGDVFGIGSARVQAPLALAGAGVEAVLAPAFAPIFFETCLNGAHLLPLVWPRPVLPATGTAARLDLGSTEARLAIAGSTRGFTHGLPAWAIEGRTWMDFIAARAAAAGGLDRLRRRGLAER